MKASCLGTALLGGFLVLSSAAIAQEMEPADPPVPTAPNVLIVFIDDLGLEQLAAYDDVNLYGLVGNDYPYAYTPTLDMLADNGVRFNQARAYPLCSPSRAALQSGQYGLRTGCSYLVQGPTQGNPTGTYEFSVPPQPDVVTLAELADGFNAGISTGFFGKCHLHLELDDCGPGCGTGDDYPRTVLGYDTYRGIARNPNNNPHPPVSDGCGLPIGQVSYTYYYWIEDGVRWTIQPVPPETDPCKGPYLTRQQRERTQDWIQNTAGEPFLAVWNMNAIHGPLQWPPYEGGTGHGFGFAEPAPEHRNTRGRAMLEYLDGSLGRLLAGMNPATLARTTIIVMGDNGTQNSLHPDGYISTTEGRYPRCHPLYQAGDENIPFSMTPYDMSHMKGSAYEQGVRVPLLVFGYGVENPGRTSDALVDVTDVFETVNELIHDYRGLTYLPPNGDSISFFDILQGGPDASHPRQFSHAALSRPNGVGAVHSTERSFYIRRDPATGDLWKIVHRLDTAAGQDYDEFYNVRIDLLERNNLGINHPEYAATRTAFDNL